MRPPGGIVTRFVTLSHPSNGDGRYSVAIVIVTAVTLTFERIDGPVAYYLLPHDNTDFVLEKLTEVRIRRCNCP